MLACSRAGRPWLPEVSVGRRSLSLLYQRPRYMYVYWMLTCFLAPVSPLGQDITIWRFSLDRNQLLVPCGSHIGNLSERLSTGDIDGTWDRGCGLMILTHRNQFWVRWPLCIPERVLRWSLPRLEYEKFFKAWEPRVAWRSLQLPCTIWAVLSFLPLFLPVPLVPDTYINIYKHPPRY